MDKILYDYKKDMFFSDKTGEQVEIPYVENFLLTYKEAKNLQDKLHRRNVQIADLKQQIETLKALLKEINDSIDFKDNNRSMLGKKVEKIVNA